jgi:hypothetical protein
VVVMPLVKSKVAIQKEFIGDRQLDKIQDNANNAHRTLNATPLTPVRGRHKKGVTIAAGDDAVVTHGLGRVPNGYTITRSRTGPAAIYDTAWDERTVTFHNDGITTTVVDLWIY